MLLNERGPRGGNARTSEKPIDYRQDTTKYSTQQAESPAPRQHIRIFTADADAPAPGMPDFTNLRRIIRRRAGRRVVGWRLDVRGTTVRFSTQAILRGPACAEFRACCVAGTQWSPPLRTVAEWQHALAALAEGRVA